MAYTSGMAKAKNPVIKLPQILFTKEGLGKIQKRFDYLTEYRKEVLVRLQAAREMGDLSENGAYKSARFELGDTDRELKRLRYQLRFGEVGKSQGGGKIGFGNTVSLNDGKRNIVFTLVSGYESDPKQKKLSIKSPFGKAVMGKEVGDMVIVEAPSGEKEFEIVGVE